MILLHKGTSLMLLACVVRPVLEGGVQEATMKEQTGDMEGKVIGLRWGLSIHQSCHLNIKTDSWKVKVLLTTQLRKY